MALGRTCRLLLIVSGMFLLITGVSEWRGALDLVGEAPLGELLVMRSHGTLKAGLGLGFFAMSAAGATAKRQQDHESE